MKARSAAAAIWSRRAWSASRSGRDRLAGRQDGGQGVGNGRGRHGFSLRMNVHSSNERSFSSPTITAQLCPYCFVWDRAALIPSRPRERASSGRSRGGPNIPINLDHGLAGPDRRRRPPRAPASDLLRQPTTCIPPSTATGCWRGCSPRFPDLASADAIRALFDVAVHRRRGRRRTRLLRLADTAAASSGPTAGRGCSSWPAELTPLRAEAAAGPPRSRRWPS